ncbi:MAG TPA: Xaa-Pro peptidase family protein [Acidobacteriaceae bacterium]|nr:Xaa-Pro peptidase family protein [Acidobacteriaceae bacterium]
MKQLRTAVQSQFPSLDALLLTHPPDVRYLTGFTGSNAAVVLPISGGSIRKKNSAVLFTDGRYIEQAQQQTQDATVVIAQGPVLGEASAWMQARNIRSCGVDAEHTTIATLEALRRSISPRDQKKFFQPVPSMVASQRQIKTPEEIARLRAAAQLGCALFDKLLSVLEPGKRETEIAAHLEFAARMGGAEAMSFETIIASGRRSALPHGHASVQRLPKRGFVVLDFGVMLSGYCSDMTRTVHLGPATGAERSAYEAVLEAQMAGVAAARHGVTCATVDEAARSALRRRKLADHFTHSTGHGLGLEIHEGPRIAAGQEQQLQAGMVVTVEPGVYLPGRFGIRIEDTVVVTRGEPQVLTPATKAWIEL